MAWQPGDCYYRLLTPVYGLAEADFLLSVNALAAVAQVGDGTGDKESRQGIEPEHFGPDEDGGEKRVRGSAEDGSIPEGCGKREGDPYDGRNYCAERCPDGEQRGDLAALEQILING